MDQYFDIGNKEKNNLTLVKEVELEEFHDYFMLGLREKTESSIKISFVFRPN